MEDYLLLTPGPTQVPPRVLAKLSQPIIHHRTGEFQEVLKRVQAQLQKVFWTQHPVLTFASSGTGAMEGSIVNLFSPGEKILSFSAGKWGERYRDIARVYGLDVKSFERPYGTAFSAGEVEAALKEHPDARGVLIALCETSTAVLHPVEAIAQITRNKKALFLVDAISGLGCDTMKMDAWGVDVVVGGSQKGFMLPPGLSFVALNDRAQERLAGSRLPKYYFHFGEALKALKRNDTPFTPAVGLIRGLEESLSMLTQEGIERVWERHRRIASHVRESVRRFGLKLFAQAPSEAVTAIEMPGGIGSGEVLAILRDPHRVVMADGQGELKGRIVRFAHMGAACNDRDAERGLSGLFDAMRKKGFS